MHWSYRLLFLTLIFLTACETEPLSEDGRRFRLREPARTGVTFANQLDETETFNIIQYLYYYNGGGVAAGDLDSDGLPELFFTGNQVSNRLYRNRGNWRFEDITDRAGVGTDGPWSTGVTMADVNGDGRLDIYVCQVGDYKVLQGRNQLFINEGNLQFREAAAEYGLDFRGFSTQAAFFDYDRDGDLDCYLLNHSVHATENYGRAELRETPDPLAGDRLFRNDGDRFTDVTAGAGIYSSRIGYGLGLSTGDLNNDGWPDIYVSNDFHDNDYLYYNNGDGTFTEGIQNSIGHSSTFSMGSDLADFDNDGWLDLISLDMKPEEETVLKSSVGADPYNIYQFKLRFGYHYQYPRNMLQVNRGPLTGEGVQFSEIGQLSGTAATDWSWSALFCDFDGDARKDLFISNGIWRRPNDLDYLKYLSNEQVQQSAGDLELASHMPEGKVPNYAFYNKGNWTFADSSSAWGLDLLGCSNGAAYADLDADGDPDLVLNNLNAPAGLYENRTEDGQFLTIRLEGEGKNRFGLGARVTLTGPVGEQTQELYTTRGFQSAVPPELYFGLGGKKSETSLTVRWPDGRVQQLASLPAGSLAVLTQSEARYPDEEDKNADVPLFENITTRSGLDFVHRENPFNDFDREKLLPHMLSTQGPALATADADGDGLADVFIGGARGQSGRLYRQLAGGRFKAAEIPAFEEDAPREQVDAVFFDADGDGDADLYVVSGGGEEAGEAEPLRDRLYRNDGRGNFTADTTALPAFFGNGSCVLPFDYDGDGDTDLLVGGRSVPGYYGLSPRSYLLENDGRGVFRDVTEAVAPALAQAGMVTDAAWLPEERRLVIVGEWMPVTFFYPDRNWEKEELPNSHGWWNTVETIDQDGDGDRDLLLGNWGLNSDLKTSVWEPVELYVRDFDNNETYDPVLTYYKQGKSYTYSSKDELAKQLVVINKKFTAYEAFAESTFEEVFSPEELKEAEQRKAVTFVSSLAVNQSNGRFRLVVLPNSIQIAPLFAFAAGDWNGDDRADLLAVGNFHAVQPSLGRYDASYGHCLVGTGGLEEIDPVRSGFVVPGEGRQIAVLSADDGTTLIIVARNDAGVLVFRNRKPTGTDPF